MTHLLKTFIRDPFAHFILIGAALFVLYDLVKAEPSSPNLITISAAEIERTTSQWQQRWQRAPSEAELNLVIEKQIREEIFYREALAIDLGRDDPIVRRRLAEKMAFIASDLLIPPPPTDGELNDYIAANSAQFLTPVRLSFSQVFISAERDEPMKDALQILAQLQDKPDPIDSLSISYLSLGDTFTGKPAYSHITDHQLARLFGRHFTEQVLSQPAGQWLGPIASAYGQHLINITDRIDATLPQLADIKARVIPLWLAEQQEISNDSLYARLKENYQIEIEMPTALIATAPLAAKLPSADASTQAQ